MNLKIFALSQLLSLFSLVSSAQSLAPMMDNMLRQVFEPLGRFSYAHSIKALPNARQESNAKYTLDSIYTDPFISYFHYNSDGNLVLLESFTRDSESEAIAPVKTEIAYDGNNVIWSELLRWDKATGQWKNLSKDSYSYTIKGELSDIIGYTWDGAAYVPMSKEVFLYNEMGRLISENIYFHPAAPSNLISKKEYIYNSLGQVSEVLHAQCERGSCATNRKTRYTYNSLGIAIKDEWLVYNSNADAFVDSKKYERSIDDAGNVAEEIFYEWEELTMKWIPVNKEVFTYDNSYTFDDLILPVLSKRWEPGYGFNHMKTSSQSFTWHSNLNSFVETNPTKTLYYYNPASLTFVLAEKRTSHSIYPNPVAESCTIHLGEKISGSTALEVFDINGQKVFSTKVEDGAAISLDFLKTGIYFYQVGSGAKNQKGKLLKE